MDGSTLFEAICRDSALVVRVTAASQASPDQSALARGLSALIAEETPACLIVTLASEATIPSAFINTLLQLRNQLETWHGTIKICATPGVAREKLITLNLVGTVFEVLESEDAGS